MALFDKVTAFAPDEKNYIAIFKSLYKSDFTLEGYLGWSEASINLMRVMYLPAKALQIMGFSDFYSMRTLTIFYSLLTLSMLLKLSSDIRFLGRSVKFWIVAGFFTPSFFLWTSLALREGFIFFSLVGIYAGIATRNTSNAKARILLILISATFLLVSKSYLYALFILSILAAVIALSLLTKEFHSRSLLILVLCLIPALLLPSISAGVLTSAWSSLEIRAVTSTSTPAQEFRGSGQTLNDLVKELRNNPILESASKITGAEDFLIKKAQKSNLDMDSGKSAERFMLRQTQPATLGNPLSMFKAAQHFLFFPAPFTDNGSLFLNLQSYESFFWYIYYALISVLIFGLLRGRYEPNLQTITATFFSVSFVFMSALIEINVGTAVRHRSVLLIGILITLAALREKSNVNERLGAQKSNLNP